MLPQIPLEEATGGAKGDEYLMKELEFKLDMAAKLARKGKCRAAISFNWRSLPASPPPPPNHVHQGGPRRAQEGRPLQDGHGRTAPRPTRWIPATYPDQFTGTVGWGSMANSLTEVDAKGNIIPDLAESFEPSDDAKTWVFKLRKGATFHNGKTVTPTDVSPPSATTWARTRNRPPSRCCRCQCRHQGGRATRSSSSSPAAMPTSPISPATIISRSCRRRTTAPSTGSRHPHRPLYPREVRARRQRQP